MAFTAFAVTAPGLESLAITELAAAGIVPTGSERGGVSFAATAGELANALVFPRTLTRVLVRIAEFRVTTFAMLERKANAVPWSEYLAPGQSARFRVTCRKSRLYHSDAVAERLAGGVTRAVRGATVTRAAGVDDDETGEAQLFIVRLANDVCTISADAAGAPLHKRGYRQAVAKAPLRETLAAAMLIGAGWTGADALYDPMCGSGTLVIEGALLARRVAPGLQRAFAAEQWPASDAAVWRAVRAHGESMMLPRAGVPIEGSDRDAGAIDASRANAERAGVAADVQFRVLPLSAAAAPAPSGLLVTNPPYGVRVGDLRALRDLYAAFGRVARTQFRGWSCVVLSGDQSPGRALERQIGVALEPVWKTTNGGLPVRLLRTS